MLVRLRRDDLRLLKKEIPGKIRFIGDLKDRSAERERFMREVMNGNKLLGEEHQARPLIIIDKKVSDVEDSRVQFFEPSSSTEILKIRRYNSGKRRSMYGDVEYTVSDKKPIEEGMTPLFLGDASKAWGVYAGEGEHFHPEYITGHEEEPRHSGKYAVIEVGTGKCFYYNHKLGNGGLVVTPRSAFYHGKVHVIRVSVHEAMTDRVDKLIFYRGSIEGIEEDPEKEIDVDLRLGMVRSNMQRWATDSIKTSLLLGSFSEIMWHIGLLYGGKVKEIYENQYFGSKSRLDMMEEYPIKMKEWVEILKKCPELKYEVESGNGAPSFEARDIDFISNIDIPTNFKPFGSNISYRVLGKVPRKYDTLGINDEGNCVPVASHLLFNYMRKKWDLKAYRVYAEIPGFTVQDPLVWENNLMLKKGSMMKIKSTIVETLYLECSAEMNDKDREAVGEINTQLALDTVSTTNICVSSSAGGWDMLEGIRQEDGFIWDVRGGEDHEESLENFEGKVKWTKGDYSICEREGILNVSTMEAPCSVRIAKREIMHALASCKLDENIENRILNDIFGLYGFHGYNKWFASRKKIGGISALCSLSGGNLRPVPAGALIAFDNTDTTAHHALFRFEQLNSKEYKMEICSHRAGARYSVGNFIVSGKEIKFIGISSMVLKNRPFIVIYEWQLCKYGQEFMNSVLPNFRGPMMRAAMRNLEKIMKGISTGMDKKVYAMKTCDLDKEEWCRSCEVPIGDYFELTLESKKFYKMDWLFKQWIMTENMYKRRNMREVNCRDGGDVWDIGEVPRSSLPLTALGSGYLGDGRIISFADHREGCYFVLGKEISLSHCNSGGNITNYWNPTKFGQLSLVSSRSRVITDGENRRLYERLNDGGSHGTIVSIYSSLGTAYLIIINESIEEEDDDTSSEGSATIPEDIYSERREEINENIKILYPELNQNWKSAVERLFNEGLTDSCISRMTVVGSMINWNFLEFPIQDVDLWLRVDFKIDFDIKRRTEFMRRFIRENFPGAKSFFWKRRETVASKVMVRLGGRKVPLCISFVGSETYDFVSARSEELSEELCGHVVQVGTFIGDNGFLNQQKISRQVLIIASEQAMRMAEERNVRKGNDITKYVIEVLCWLFSEDCDQYLDRKGWHGKGEKTGCYVRGGKSDLRGGEMALIYKKLKSLKFNGNDKQRYAGPPRLTRIESREIISCNEEEGSGAVDAEMMAFIMKDEKCSTRRMDDLFLEFDNDWRDICMGSPWFECGREFSYVGESVTPDSHMIKGILEEGPMSVEDIITKLGKVGRVSRRRVKLNIEQILRKYRWFLEKEGIWGINFNP